MSSWQKASPVAARHASLVLAHLLSAVSDYQVTATVLHPTYSALSQHGWSQLLRKLVTFLRRLCTSEVYLFIRSITAPLPTQGTLPSIPWYFQYSPLIYITYLSWSSSQAVLTLCVLSLPPDRLAIPPWYQSMTGWCSVRSSFKAALFREESVACVALNEYSHQRKTTR